MHSQSHPHPHPFNNPCFHITYYTSIYKNNNYRDNKSTCFNNYSTYSNGHLNDYIHYNTHRTTQYNCCNINPRYHFTYYTSNYKSNNYRDNKPTCFNNYSTYSNGHLNDYIHYNTHCTTQYNCCNINPRYHFTYYTSNYKKYHDETNHLSNCHLNNYIYNNNCTTNNNYRDNKSTCFNNYSTYSNGHLNDYIHYNTHRTTQYNCCNINPRYHFTYYTSNYKSNNYRDNKPTCFNNYSTYSNGHLNDYIHYNTHCTTKYNCCNINPRYHFTYYTSNYKKYHDETNHLSNCHLNNYIYNNNCTTKNIYRDNKSTCFNNYSTYSNVHLNDYIYNNTHCTTQYNCCNINPRFHITYYNSNNYDKEYRD
ncbi:unnamed protein product [Arctogadus glacialis]